MGTFVNRGWFISLTVPVKMAESMDIVKPILAKKFGDGAMTIEPLVSVLISGTEFYGC